MACRSSRSSAWLTALTCLIAGVVVFAARGNDGDTVVPPAPAEVINPAAGEDSAQIVLAGGCFWCTEVAMERVRGVTDVVSGYAGGSEATADYGKVSNGETEHAEGVQVTYDPSQVTLGELFQAFFLIHDPTTADGQHPDYGTQYRPAIFYANDVQKQAAGRYLEQVRQSGLYERVATGLEPLGEGFFPAEDYHQDFVAKNPRHPYVVRWALPKVKKLETHLPGLLADDAE